MTPAGPHLSLVIPVYNERESLEPLLREIEAVANAQSYSLEILFIDDGSKDGSREELRRIAASDERLRVVGFRRNFGKAAALAAGFARAKGEFVITLDADLQDDPAEIPNFLKTLNEGYDLVSGWKKIRHDPWHKVFPSRVFNAMVSRLTGVKLHDHNCGMKCYKAEVAKAINLYGELHRFTPSLAAMHGYRVGEMVLHHRARKFGKSKYGAKRFLKGFLDLVTVSFRMKYGQRPMHPLGFLALLFLLLGIPASIWLPGYQFLCWILAVHFFLAGLLAELTLARTAKPADFYDVAEEFGGTPRG